MSCTNESKVFHASHGLVHRVTYGAMFHGGSTIFVEANLQAIYDVVKCCMFYVYDTLI